MELYVLANGLDVVLLGGIDLVDHDHIGAPQVDFTGEVSQFMPRTVRVYDYDFQVGRIEGSVVVASIPQDDVGFFLRLAEDLFVVHSRIHHGSFADVRFVLFALLNGALLQVEVLHGGEALHRLLRQITVRHGVPNHDWPSTLLAQFFGDQARDRALAASGSHCAHGDRPAATT